MSSLKKIAKTFGKDIGSLQPKSKTAYGFEKEKKGKKKKPKSFRIRSGLETEPRGLISQFPTGVQSAFKKKKKQINPFLSNEEEFY